MLGEGPKSITTGVYGWHSSNEEMELIRLARQYVPSDGIIVELGGEYGKSAAEFLYATKEYPDGDHVSVFTVDTFPLDHHLVGDLMKVQTQNIQEALPTEAWRHIQIKSISWEAARNFNYEIDLLFIDAGHHYEEVRRDIEAWYGKVKAGGVIVFHDVWKNEQSHPLHLEVKRAVDEFYESHKDEYTFRDAPDSLVYMVKKEKSTLKKVVDSVKEIVNPKEDLDKTIEYKMENVHTLNAKEVQRVKEVIETEQKAKPKGRPKKQ